MGKQVSRLPDRKIKWQTVVNVKSDPLFCSLQCLGLEHKYIKQTLDINYEFTTGYTFDNTVAYGQKEMGEFFGLIVHKLQGDSKYLYTFPQRVYVIANDLLGFAKEVQSKSNFTDLSNAELNKIFTSYIEKCAYAFPIVMISIPMEIIITGELEKVVRGKLKLKNALDAFKKVMQDLTQYSVKETFFQQDYRKLLKIGQKIKEDKNLLKVFQEKSAAGILKHLERNNIRLYKKLNQHNKEYGWINMVEFRRGPFAIEQLIDRVKDILEKDCKGTLDNLVKKKKRSENVFKDAIKDLNIKGILKKKTEMLPELVYLRTYRFDIFTLSAYYMRPLFLEIASRFGLTYDEFIHLTLFEISEVLLGKKKISSIPVKKRAKDYALIQIDGQFEVIVDEERLQKLGRKKKKKVGDVKEIKGNVACRGKAQGPAKIVMHATQLTKVERGDVLVAPMTSPDFVVAMLKAVAIVTDHGGITCHAAIVSRELNIPCVIATEIATEVLEDGDMIEVDAYNGIVRKL